MTTLKRRKEEITLGVVRLLNQYVNYFKNNEGREAVADRIWLQYIGRIHRKYPQWLFPTMKSQGSRMSPTFRSIPTRVEFGEKMADLLLGKGKWRTNPDEEKRCIEYDECSMYYRSDDYWLRICVRDLSLGPMGVRDGDREDKQWVMYFNVVKNGEARGLSREHEEQDDEDEYQEMVAKGYMKPPEGVDKVLIPNWEYYVSSSDDASDSAGEGAAGGAERVKRARRENEEEAGDDQGEREDRPRGDGSGMSDYAVVLRELHERLKILEAKQGVA